MRNEHVDYDIHLHLISEDAILFRRLNFFFHRHTEWHITHSTRFRLPKRTTLLIIPAFMLIEFRRHYRSENNDSHSDIPVIAFGDVAYSTICFISGCDDFLKIPWTFEELFYRVQRLITPSVFTSQGLRLRISPSIAQCGERSISLSFLEYRLLTLLMRNIGEPVSRSVIFRRLFDKTVVDSRVVDIYISKIRRKLREIMPYHTAISAIRTIRGFGYELLG